MPARECPGQPYPGMENKADIQEKRRDLVLSTDGLRRKRVLVLERGRLFPSWRHTHSKTSCNDFCCKDYILRHSHIGSVRNKKFTAKPLPGKKRAERGQRGV